LEYSKLILPGMPDEFLQEFLRSIPCVQRYMGEKFEEAFYFHHHLCQEVDTEALPCPQSQAIEIQKVRNLFRFITPN
jgi:hypothetical protein